MIWMVFVFLIGLALCIFLGALTVRLTRRIPRRRPGIALAAVLMIPLLLGALICLGGIKNCLDGDLRSLAGEWECAETLVEDPEAYTGYLQLALSPTGRFSMYDAEAGNPGLEGVLLRLNSRELLLICTNYAEMEPPNGWWDMGVIETVEYTLEEDGLLLRYADSGGTATLRFLPLDS